MADKDIWLNLPVKNMPKTKSFFKALGFQFNENFPGANHWACMLAGKNKTVVMFIPEEDFKTFTQIPVANTSNGSEILISVELENKNEVDLAASLVENNGGTIYAKPASMDGWMYGFAFADPDGHRWNLIYMDWSKAKR